MKNKKFIVIILIISILIGVLVKEYSSREIKKDDINVSKYIKYADLASKNNAQVNWKYVASIVAVLNKNNLKNVKDSQIQEVSDLFVKNFSKNNKINKLSDVLDELEFSNRQKRLVDNYIDNLKDYGIKPERLKSDTKYMKFINEIKTEAIQNYKDYKILPSITIAQAIIESSWGKSTLAKQYNNLFGIKADAYWKGKSVTLETKEHLDTIIDDKFRIYDDKNESIKDHAKFLATNKRYKNNGVFDAKTYIYQAKALEKAGYSTAKDENGNSIYAARLIELIQQYNLQLIDSEIQSEM
ncbi:TPA: glucosaminidase domain-containing protein [Clostridioides difficile]|uniref:glycoside hydrolase family 73 protein n=1 Tax=Clostridioides difficile TaxID=1496 RepID=UPI00038C8BD7|nr:glucosaminidase domain-containing protein [Clostridioides difficile]AXU28190.1 phage-related cell wall hydrolase [Clostridioides difficile]AXU31987.1 phage-related cell wall hydrolase [Clostridioides difficile]AXU35775.1 phage-related cell wall hydrolase [Clostridioides difficile]EGT4967504.1 glucosaminidase [Clostridioides difficile]EQE85151.1 mannosyl-glycoendo-beta-N-acetylglucosaminidase family protein [Clostridioides difficile CD69]